MLVVASANVFPFYAHLLRFRGNCPHTFSL